MFGKTQKLELLNTTSEDHVITWKEYYDSLVFIGISTGCTISVLRKAIECAMQAIILIVGIDEVKSQRNIDRLKRELRVCYPLIDRILDSIDSGDNQNQHPSDLIDLVEVIMTPENHLIQIVLDSYTECVDSVYCCVLINGKIAAATEDWWSLHPIELKLLANLATIENTMTSKDIPVFLPYKSPNVAFRFVAVTISPDIQVCNLCGPTPALEDIEHSAAQCFKSNLDVLEAAAECHPRNFPDSPDWVLDSNILGLLMINVKFGKFMMSKLVPQASKKSASSHRLDILRTFYYQTISDHFLANANTESVKDNQLTQTEATETYWCSEYHKCHALKSNDIILCVLYNSNVLIPMMRSLTQNTLKVFLGSDKQTCF
ncbi:protein fuzzy homolog isoform X2 [Atheta coriaria]